MWVINEYLNICRLILVILFDFLSKIYAVAYLNICDKKITTSTIILIWNSLLKLDVRENTCCCWFSSIVLFCFSNNLRYSQRATSVMCMKQ